MRCFQHPAERLYAVIDIETCDRVGRRPLDVARAFFSAGVRVVQVRAKALASGRFLDLSAAVVEAAQPTAATVIVNDRSDIAALSNAAGVHVGQDDLTPDQAARVIGPDTIIGLSTHTASQVAEAIGLPISYLAMGPVFATSTKATGYDAVGHAAVARAAAAARSRGLPVVAIGGITLETAPTLIAAGAASVAVIGDLLAGDPETRAREYLAALA